MASPAAVPVFRGGNNGKLVTVQLSLSSERRTTRPIN